MFGSVISMVFSHRFFAMFLGCLSRLTRHLVIGSVLSMEFPAMGMMYDTEFCRVSYIRTTPIDDTYETPPL
jgi:hypothetical protein